MSEKVTVNSIFPDFNRWDGFLSRQDPRFVQRPFVDKYLLYYGNGNFNYRSPTGVQNSIEYYNANYPDHHNPVHLVPCRLSQDYKDLANKYNVSVNVNNNYLSVALNIIDPTSQFEVVYISSENQMLDGSESGKKMQQVFMCLSDKYLQQLKDENVISKNSRKRVWIKYFLGKISCTHEGPIGSPDFLLTDETLKKICDDSRFDFYTDLDREVTSGRIGQVPFSLSHAAIAKLDPEKVWRSLAGQNQENPFIFPVKVEKVT